MSRLQRSRVIIFSVITRNSYGVYRAPFLSSCYKHAASTRLVLQIGVPQRRLHGKNADFLKSGTKKLDTIFLVPGKLVPCDSIAIIAA